MQQWKEWLKESLPVGVMSRQDSCAICRTANLDYIHGTDGSGIVGKMVQVG